VTVVAPNASIAASAMLDFMVASRLMRGEDWASRNRARVIRSYRCRRDPLRSYYASPRDFTPSVADRFLPHSAWSSTVADRPDPVFHTADFRYDRPDFLI